jgi:hypothetical protein
MLTVTLAQLAKMTPEQREVRLRGIDEPTAQRLMLEAAHIVAEISSERLRQITR